MTLENQVVSLELAQKLKELGVKQESLFWWQYFEGFNGEMLNYNRDKNTSQEVVSVSAFTVAELGEMLPAGMTSGKRIVIQTGKIQESVDRWNCYCQGLFEDLSPWAFNKTADTEADARAKMLVYLLENNLITPPIK